MSRYPSPTLVQSRPVVLEIDRMTESNLCTAHGKRDDEGVSGCHAIYMVDW